MKKLSVLIVSLALVFTGAGCTKLADFIGSLRAARGGGPSAEDSAVQMKADTSYTNSYLGFSFTVPKSWWLYAANENNFAPDPALTESPDILDISYGEDNGENYSFIRLVSFANLKDSRKDNHLGFDISAETLDGVFSVEEYMEYLETYMLAPDENTYRMLDAGREEINGLRYETRSFEVIRDEDNFIYVTYTRPVGNNYYLTIKASYWPDNLNAETFIMNCLSKAMR